MSFFIILFFYTNICPSINFSTPQASIVLRKEGTFFAAPNSTSITGWYGQNLIREAGLENIKTFNNTIGYDSAPQQRINNTFSDNQVATTSSLDPLLKVIYLNDDILIADNTTFTITSSGVLDGLGKNFTIGRNSQLLVDTNVSLTVKNITFKNILNGSITPIKCHDSSGQLTFDSCTLAFNNTFTFERGTFFINNDVSITGTSEFILNSINPMYILPHSSLNFKPSTSFLYAPYSANNSLVILQEKTSKLNFDNSSLKMTATGVKLTTGSLYLDNQVTLSSSNQTFENGLILGESNKGSNFDLDIYILAGARVNIDGKVLLDNTTLTQNNLNFSNKTASIVMKNSRSKFKITNNEGISGWEQQSIIKASGNDNSWVTDNTTYGFEAGETTPPTHFVYNNSNAIVSQEDDMNWNSNAIITLERNIENNSNAILNNQDEIRYNSEAIINSDVVALQVKIGQNSNAILLHEDKIRWNSNAIIDSPTLINHNSNAIVTLDSEVNNISNATINNDTNITNNSNAIINNQNNIIYNSNAIINNESDITTNTNNIINNSNAILLQEDKIRWNSNAIINSPTLITNNSNAIVTLDNEVNNISNATINNDTNITNNSNAIINNQNNIIYNSNAIKKNESDITTNTNNITNNSNAILLQDNKIRWNSEAIVNSEASNLQKQIKNNSNAIINLTPTGLDQKITNNSNSIISQEDKIRWNSEAIINSDAITLQDEIKHNSDAIIYLDSADLNQKITNNSNTIISQEDKIRWNSDAIINSDSITLQNSIRYNSNAIIKQEDKIHWNSQTIINNNSSIRYNSNAIILHKEKLNYISNATIKNDSKINYNSNTIITNGYNISYNSSTIINNKENIAINTNEINNNSNAILSQENKIHWNSQAIISIYNNGLAINNSNSIIYMKNEISHLSSATIENDNEIRYNSNVIITYQLDNLQDQIRHNSNAIINSDAATLSQDITNNSNAIVYATDKIHYNSQAIINDYEIKDDLQNQIRYNSNAILSIDVSTLESEIKHNSDAILKIIANPKETILTQAPITGDIDLKDSVFINTDETIFVEDNATINGNGAVVIFSSPENAQFIVAKGKTVTLKNIQFLRINQNTFDLRYNVYVDGGSISGWTLEEGQIKIGQNVLFGLSENITISQSLIELMNNDASEAQTFELKGIEGQKQFQLAPSDDYFNALSRADNGLTLAQRKNGNAGTASQLPERFTQNGSAPVLVKCNDNTFGIQNINLVGLEHISKSTSIDYTGALGLLGNAAVNAGNNAYLDFVNNTGIQESYNMVFVVQGLDNELRLLKDNLLFNGELQFADYGESVLKINSVLTERIDTSISRTIPQVQFDTDFIQITSIYGMARLIFDDNRIRISNSLNAIVAYENSYLGGKTIEVTGDPIWDLYDPTLGGKEFVLEVNELLGLEDIDYQPLISENYLALRNNKQKMRTAIDLAYEKEIEYLIKLYPELDSGYSPVN